MARQELGELTKLATDEMNSASAVQEVMEALCRIGEGFKNLTGVVDRDEHHYIGGGTFGDVYKGIWLDDSVETAYPEIAVKVLRSTGTIEPDALAKRLKVCSSCPVYLGPLVNNC